MNIPSQIKIGARTYNVIELEEDAGMQTDIVGQTDHRSQTIKLLRLASRQAREQTLLHEIVHTQRFWRGASELQETGGDVSMEQIDMFSLLSGGGRRALSFDELAYMTGRKIELVLRTAEREWSLFGCVVRIQRDGDRQVLVYKTEDAGYGLINEYEFSDDLAYPARAYEVE